MRFLVERKNSYGVVRLRSLEAVQFNSGLSIAYVDLRAAKDGKPVTCRFGKAMGSSVKGCAIKGLFTSFISWINNEYRDEMIGTPVEIGPAVKPVEKRLPTDIPARPKAKPVETQTSNREPVKSKAGSATAESVDAILEWM